MNFFSDKSPCFRQPATPGTAGMPMQFPGGAMMPMIQGAMVSQFPTGMPTGPSLAPMPAPAITAPPGEQPPQTVQSTMYTPGFLKTQIGKKVRVEFLIGTSSMTDRIGTLVGVGASYILLRLEETDDIMLCDIYSIKFVTFYM